MFGAVLAAVLPLEVVEEVEERVKGDHTRLGGVDARRVTEDGGGRHRVQHLLLVAPRLEIGQVHRAVSRQGACKGGGRKPTEV